MNPDRFQVKVSLTLCFLQAFPQLIRKKKRETKDYKIKIFVIIMFFIIIFLVSKLGTQGRY